MNLNVVVRGGGDLATGVAHRLFKSGMKVIITEIAEPLVIRRTVAFASAVYGGEFTVEGVTAKFQKTEPVFTNEFIPVIVDPECSVWHRLKPDVIVDVIMAKTNKGTFKYMAPVVIALGPGFNAGTDVHRVIETQRGHYLGKIIDEGFAENDTGIPGEIGGCSSQRVIRAPEDGIFTSEKQIGDTVKEGDIVGKVRDLEVKTGISGVVRGLIRDGIHVTKNLKIGDIDPRGRKEFICNISDKARALGGSVLEAIMNCYSDRFIFFEK